MSYLIYKIDEGILTYYFLRFKISVSNRLVLNLAWQASVSSTIVQF